MPQIALFGAGRMAARQMRFISLVPPQNTVAVVQVVTRGINIDCGCFGEASGPVDGLTVLRDLLLLGACAALLVCLQRLRQHATEAR